MMKILYDILVIFQCIKASLMNLVYNPVGIVLFVASSIPIFGIYMVNVSSSAGGGSSGGMVMIVKFPIGNCRQGPSQRSLVILQSSKSIINGQLARPLAYPLSHTFWTLSVHDLCSRVYLQYYIVLEVSLSILEYVS